MPDAFAGEAPHHAEMVRRSRPAVVVAALASPLRGACVEVLLA